MAAFTMTRTAKYPIAATGSHEADSLRKVLIVCGGVDFLPRIGYTMQVIRTERARAMLSQKRESVPASGETL